VDLIAHLDDKILDELYFKELYRDDYYATYGGGSKKPGPEIRRYVLPLDTVKDNLANLVTLPGSSASAWRQVDGSLLCKPEVLLPASKGFELPVINYRRFNGEKHRFVYGMDLWRNEAKGEIIKLDVKTKRDTVWSREGCYPSEPIFVARPGKGVFQGVSMDSLKYC
jgi:beta-carotene 15,15'-monooxygenase